MTFYVYLHRRSDTNEVFYIGKGSGSEKRARTQNKTLRSAWWKAIVAKAGGRTVQILAHWPTEAEAFEHEKLLIACFRDLGAPLCNMTDGGDGASGHPQSAETRAKIAAAKTGVKRPPFSAEWRKNMGDASRGRPRSAEICAKISAAKTGVKRPPFSAEWRAKLATAGTGRVPTPEARANMRKAQAKLAAAKRASK